MLPFLRPTGKKLKALSATFSEFLFDAIDSNRNGSISTAEFRKFHDVIFGFGKVSEEFTNKAFETIDTDCDGTISRSEFIKASNDYDFECRGDENSVPLLFGPLPDE